MDTKKETKKWSKWIRIMQKLNLDCTGIKTQLYRRFNKNVSGKSFFLNLILFCLDFFLTLRTKGLKV